MAISQLKGKNVPIKLWAKIEEVESAALTQLKNIASLPWCFSPFSLGFISERAR